MTERLERRITLLEKKISPPQGSFDVVKHTTDIRIETERLMQLPQADYEEELREPASSKAQQIARHGATHQKRILSLTPEEQEEEMGYLYKPELTAAQKERLESQKNWITDLAERAAKLRN